MVLGARIGLAQGVGLAPLHLGDVGLVRVPLEKASDEADGVERPRGQLFPQLDGAVDERLGLHDLGDEAGRVGFFRRDHAAGEAPLERAAGSHEPGQEVGAAELGDEAHADEEEADARVPAGDAHVERQHLGDPDAHGGAIDRGDRGLRHAPEECQVVLAGLRAPLGPAGLALALDLGIEHGADVGARAERAARARHDDGADLRVGIAPRDGVAVLRHHARRPGIELLGPAQGDDADPALLLERDLLVGHRRVASGRGHQSRLSSDRSR